MKIHISGKITGLHKWRAWYLFVVAEIRLRKKYKCVVVNPMNEVPYKKGKTWHEYMSDDLLLMESCDTIFMLKNWRSSKGARIERYIAKQTGMKIIYQSKIHKFLWWLWK